jgi:hypothetical protein
MFAYLNELVYRDEGNDEPKNGTSIPPDFLEGKGGILKQGVPFFTTEGGPEPTKFKAQHTCLPVNLDEFFPAASSAGAGVKPVKLRLPLAKAISKLTGTINEAKEMSTGRNMKKTTNDKKMANEDIRIKEDTILGSPWESPSKGGYYRTIYKRVIKINDTIINKVGTDSLGKTLKPRHYK